MIRSDQDDYLANRVEEAKADEPPAEMASVTIGGVVARRLERRAQRGVTGHEESVFEIAVGPAKALLPRWFVIRFVRALCAIADIKAEIEG